MSGAFPSRGQLGDAGRAPGAGAGAAGRPRSPPRAAPPCPAGLCGSSLGPLGPRAASSKAAGLPLAPAPSYPPASPPSPRASRHRLAHSSRRGAPPSELRPRGASGRSSSEGIGSLGWLGRRGQPHRAPGAFNFSQHPSDSEASLSPAGDKSGLSPQPSDTAEGGASRPAHPGRHAPTGKMFSRAVVWLRRDLRARDNPALHAACLVAETVIPVYIVVPEDDGDGEGNQVSFSPGMCLRWWVSKSLCSLALALQAAGSDLALIQDTSPAAALVRLCHVTRAEVVFYSRAYDPPTAALDLDVWHSLSEMGVVVQEMDGTSLAPPAAAGVGLAASGKPFTQFAPFRDAVESLLARELPDALPAPKRMKPVPPELARWCLASCVDPKTLEASLDAKGGAPAGPGAKARRGADEGSLAVETMRVLVSEEEARVCSGLEASWKPGEAAAQGLLRTLKHSREDWSRARGGSEGADQATSGRGVADPGLIPALVAPHLTVGDISPGDLWRAVARVQERCRPRSLLAAACQELQKMAVSREWAWHVCHHWPEESMGLAFTTGGRWRHDTGLFTDWAGGQTGYPLVDACMRCLLAVGWLPDAMIEYTVAFLARHLALPWQWGLMHVWERLVSADIAPLMMVFASATGCLRDGPQLSEPLDAADAMRRLDPTTAFVRAWVPELAHLPDRHLAEPWAAPREVAAAGGYGETYPLPVGPARGSGDGILRWAAALEASARAQLRDGGGAARPALSWDAFVESDVDSVDSGRRGPPAPDSPFLPAAVIAAPRPGAASASEERSGGDPGAGDPAPPANLPAVLLAGLLVFQHAVQLAAAGPGADPAAPAPAAGAAAGPAGARRRTDESRRSGPSRPGSPGAASTGAPPCPPGDQLEGALQVQRLFLQYGGVALPLIERVLGMVLSEAPAGDWGAGGLTPDRLALALQVAVVLDNLTGQGVLRQGEPTAPEAVAAAGQLLQVGPTFNQATGSGVAHPWAGLYFPEAREPTGQTHANSAPPGRGDTSLTPHHPPPAGGGGGSPGPGGRAPRRARCRRRAGSRARGAPGRRSGRSCRAR